MRRDLPSDKGSIQTWWREQPVPNRLIMGGAAMLLAGLIAQALSPPSA